MVLDALRADRRGAAEIDLEMEFAKEGGEGATPYEVLLHAALIGDASHFTRQDSVEECWRIVEPLLDSPPKAIRYPQGSWGPAEAEKLDQRASAAGAARGCPAEREGRMSRTGVAN